jgi:CysZ protein
MADAARPGVIRRFFGGMGYLARGFRVWGTSPGLMVLGALPALIVGAVYLAAVILLGINATTIAATITPFAADWDLREPFRILVAIAMVLAVIVIAAVTFAGVTLAVGDPFYERIWRATEKRLGDAPPEPDESVWRSIRRSIGTGIRLVATSASFGLLVFAIGFIPVVGQVIAAVVGALGGGWLLTTELVGYAFDARLKSLAERRRMLRGSRATTLGFGVLVYLLFLIPLAALFVMPAAVAGATMLARDALQPSPTTR